MRKQTFVLRSQTPRHSSEWLRGVELEWKPQEGQGRVKRSFGEGEDQGAVSHLSSDAWAELVP